MKKALIGYILVQLLATLFVAVVKSAAGLTWGTEDCGILVGMTYGITLIFGLVVFPALIPSAR